MFRKMVLAAPLPGRATAPGAGPAAAEEEEEGGSPPALCGAGAG